MGKSENFSVVFGDLRDEVANRARAAKFEVEYATRTYLARVGRDSLQETEEKYLVIHLPNGRSSFRLVVGEAVARNLTALPFEEFTVLGDNAALLDKESGCIEAVVRPSGISRKRLQSLPGVVFGEGSQPCDLDSGSMGDVEESLDEPLADSGEQPKEGPWRLVVKTGDPTLTVELSSVSQTAFSVFPEFGSERSLGFESIKIRGVKSDRHDEANALLEKCAAALFFELDIRFGVTLSFERPRRRPLGLRRKLTENPKAIDILKSAYAEEAVSLYLYGRSARGMPLLQYLAFYQAIEFFFPSFWNADIMARVKNQLRDPRFDYDNDAHVQKILSISRNGGKGFSTEREQLRVTIEACVSEDDLLEFFGGLSSSETEFFTKESRIKGAEKLVIKSGGRLLDQVAQRIYTIRCRIVHSKEGGGEGQADALLPYGKESYLLSYDIGLLQFIVQKVIISGSRGKVGQ